jgi:hypothetical protein
MSDLTITTPVHDKDMAKDFLARLDPDADRFTFQFFSDGDDRCAEIFHGTLDEVWPKVLALNTPQRRAGVFVTVSETDFKGRRSDNIVRVRALFADADSDQQVRHCEETLAACGVVPSMVVKTGRGMHYYFCADLPLHQFRGSQEKLIDRLGTDPSIKDLPRVMRLPGTLHLKNPDRPKLIELVKTTTPVLRWEASELVAKLGSPASIPATPSATANAAPFSPMTPAHVSPGTLAPNPGQGNVLPNLTAADRERVQRLFGPLTGCLSDGIFTNIEEIRSAVSAIPPSAISTEPDWVKFARALAHEAAARKSRAGQLWDMLDTASRRAPGYNETDNRSRWLRYISEAFARDKPITIASVFDLARKHGWPGWAPAAADYGDGNTWAAPASGPTTWHPSGLKVSFSHIPHRQFLYGVDLIRGELTVMGSPGGIGKSSIAIGMAVSIATGRELLGEKIRGNDLKVLLINAEDSGIEIQRRVWAFCLAYNVAEQDLGRLHVAGADDPRVHRLSFLRTNEKSNLSTLDPIGFEVLEAALSAISPDVIVLDPLVALCAGGNMNDNAAMSLVMRGLKQLAAKYRCAVLIVHHTRKGGEVGSAEAIAGAAATVNLARRAIMPTPMAPEEAQKFGILASNRFRYLKLVDAKSNLAPRSADSPWYQLHSVELPNPEPPIYPFGDNVQAITRVPLPFERNAGVAADDVKIRRALLDLVDRGKVIDGQPYPYSPSTAGADNERALLDDAMAAARDATVPRQWLPSDLEALIKDTIKRMKDEKWLIDGQVKDLKPAAKRFRRGRGLAVDWARTPWSASDVAHPDGSQSVNSGAID